jgi:hypothetical protein
VIEAGSDLAEDLQALVRELDACLPEGAPQSLEAALDLGGICSQNGS